MASRIVVTGGTGFVGQRLLAALRQDRTAEVLSVGRHENADLSLDLAREDGWRKLPSEATHLVHLAAVLPTHGAKDFSDNVTMAHHVVDYAERASLERLVVASSIAVYGQAAGPLTEETDPDHPEPYGASKWEAERVLSKTPASAALLRISSVYGRRMHPGSVLPGFVRLAREGAPLAVFGDGSRTQDFVHVDDVVQAMLLALTASVKGPINIGSGEPTTMLELALAAIDAAGSTSSIERRTDSADHAPSVVLSIDRAQRELGYVPTISLERGLRAMIGSGSS